MSNLLRSCVEESLEDLLTLLEEYLDGNMYDEEYSIFAGLALPQKIQPVKIFLVSAISMIRVGRETSKFDWVD